jgi:hypothetical protein
MTAEFARLRRHENTPNANRRTSMPKTSITLNWPVGLWMAFMAAISAGLSLGFACAAPLAAFGAVSGLTLSRRNAVLATLGAWAANQACGYSCLGYPMTGESLGWGAAFGVSATLAVFAARFAGAAVSRLSRAAVPVAAFAAAFAVYEIALFMAAFAVLGGTQEFTVAVVARVLEVNAIALAGMLLVNAAAAVTSASKTTISAQA